MIHAARFTVLGFSIALAACVQGGGGGKPPTPASQQQGGATYSPLATADQADAPGAQAAANQTFETRPTNDKNLGSGDKRPTDTFQFYFVKAVQAAKPQRVVAGGNGASLATAFFAHDVGEREELQAAMNDLLARYPDRHDVSGALMRGTNRKYVVQVTFVSGGATSTLYYDVSRWVGFTRIHG
jgi:hypothetical protein